MVLITGGMGFIGLHTARKFLDAGENVVITRFRAWREPSFIKDEYGKRVTVEALDTTNAFDCIDVLRKHKVDSIVHLAVPALGALSPAEDYRTNMGSLINILEAGRIAGVKRISIASSTAVYASGLKEGPFREDQFLPISGNNPTEVYKKSFEIIAQHWSDRTKISVLALRIGGIWGPLYHSMANLPSRMVHGALKNKKVDLSAGPAGMPFEEDNADLCYVKDCAKGIQMVHMAPDLKHRVYNVASGVATSNARLREAVLKEVPGAEIALKPGKGPRYRPNACLDLTRTTADSGYKPDYTVESGIADYVAWLKAGNAQ
jgi:UDP-glucose 4-epimerase